jgi:predicted Zn-dependent protease with MMP-like domain
MSDPNSWKDEVAPSLAVIEALAVTAWNRLPPHFRKVCGDVVIRIEDFAADDVLDSLDIEDAFDLMGLYQGVSLNNKSVSDVPREPDMVFLYRRPILDYWADGEETLGAIITHVLVHEIGHHFGFSDEDMEDIEAEVAA